MGRKFLPVPISRRLFAYPNAVHYWRLDDTAAPYATYGSSTLTLKNTGASGTVNSHRRSVMTYGIDTALATGATRNCMYTDLPAVAGDIVTGTALTVSSWVMPNDLTTTQVVALKAYDSNNTLWAAPFITWALTAVGGTGFPSMQITAGTAGAGTRVTATAAIALRPREPNYLVGVYDGTNILLYVNACLAASAAQTGSLDNSTTNSNLGGVVAVAGPSSTAAGANAQNFGGTIEEVIVESAVVGRPELLGRYYRGLGLIANGGQGIF